MFDYPEVTSCGVQDIITFFLTLFARLSVQICVISLLTEEMFMPDTTAFLVTTVIKSQTAMRGVT